MSSNIAIVFGSGARVGSSVAKKFLSHNYKVVTVSRSDLTFEEFPKNHFHVNGDLADFNIVPLVFNKTREVFGEPRVIVYNAAAASIITQTPDDFLSITPQILEGDQTINVTSAFSAIQESIKTFEKTPATEKPKTFIYTGNIQNIKPVSFITTVGIGKCGAFSALGVADQLFGAKGYRFYYADERVASGEPASMGLSGEAAAEFYFDLAENGNKDIPIEATFVSGKGYFKF